MKKVSNTWFVVDNENGRQGRTSMWRAYRRPRGPPMALSQPFHKNSTECSQNFLNLIQYSASMKRFLFRCLFALGVVAALGLAAPVVASASSKSSNTQVSTQKSSHQGSGQGSRSSHQTRQTIENTFHQAIISAQTTLQDALATARTSSQRSADRQAMQAAIIQAAAARSSALSLLGN